MARYLPLTLRIICLVITILSVISTETNAGSPGRSESEGSSSLNNGYPQPWEKPRHPATHATSTLLSPHRIEPVLCLQRGISIEQARNQSRNYYECPGHRPAEYIECCENNNCCVPNYVRQYLQEKASDFEKMIALFCLSCLVIFLLYLLCLLPCCPFRWLCNSKKNRDYAGCATKMTTEGPQYQTMSQECPVGAGPILLNHHGVQLSLAAPPLPPNVRVAIAETALVDVPDDPSSSGSSSGCSSSHIVTIHANSSRGSSPTTDSSLVSLVTGRSHGTITTFSKPPVKSILKMNNYPPATIKPFGYRDPRNSLISCASVDGNGIVAAARCPMWADNML